MICSDTTPGTCRSLAADYEQLRRVALEGATAVGQFGVVILVREGVAAWVACAPARPVADMRAIASERQVAVSPVASDDAQADLVAVLTNMVLATAKERCA